MILIKIYGRRNKTEEEEEEIHFYVKFPEYCSCGLYIYSKFRVTFFFGMGSSAVINIISGIYSHRSRVIAVYSTMKS